LIYVKWVDLIGWNLVRLGGFCIQQTALRKLHFFQRKFQRERKETQTSPGKPSRKLQNENTYTGKHSSREPTLPTSTQTLKTNEEIRKQDNDELSTDSDTQEIAVDRLEQCPGSGYQTFIRCQTHLPSFLSRYPM
jgi:hypothetical protein